MEKRKCSRCGRERKLTVHKDESLCPSCLREVEQPIINLDEDPDNADWLKKRRKRNA